MKFAAIDTCIFIGDNFNFGNVKYRAMAELVKKGEIKILITDVVQREIKANIKKRVLDASSEHKAYLKKAKILHNAKLTFPEFQKEISSEGVIQEICDKVDSFFKEIGAILVDTSKICNHRVLDNYFDGKSPFAYSCVTGHRFLQ